MKRLGQIQLIVGPMFAGKTTEMIRRVKQFEKAQLRCLLVKYSGDTRYDQKADLQEVFVATHDDPYAAKATSASALMPLEAHTDEWDVIGIDEGQFFPDLVAFADTAASAGKVVVVAALDGTFERKEFGQLGDLLAVSDSITKLNAVCAVCGADAPFTRRDAAATEVKLIGGREAYTPVCRRHHASHLDAHDDDD